MLLTKQLEVYINNCNINYYKNKGYDCINNSLNIIRIEDVNKNSKIKVQFVCDYCNEKHETSFLLYNRGKETINKDCCKNCAILKTREINKLKYGNEIPLKK